MIRSVQDEVKEATASMDDTTRRLVTGVEMSNKGWRNTSDIVSRVESLQSMVQQIASPRNRGNVERGVNISAAMCRNRNQLPGNLKRRGTVSPRPPLTLPVRARIFRQQFFPVPGIGRSSRCRHQNGAGPDERLLLSVLNPFQSGVLSLTKIAQQSPKASRQR